MIRLFRLLLLIGIVLTISSSTLKGQCNGSWTNTSRLNYLCANGLYLQKDLGANICPTSAQATYSFSTPVQSIKLIFSAFGTSGSGTSRMVVFLNNSIIDLGLCNIILGCQTPSGIYSIYSGCLIDNTKGADGGISGFIYINAASFGLASITSIGVAVSEPTASGTIFEIECDEIILEMPNVFSPNNDGENDYFHPIKTNGIKQSALMIYNKWGQKLIETNNILTGWDGKYNSNDCSAGTYFWIIQYTTIMNESKTLKGFLTLIK